MPRGTLQRIKQKILARQYYLSSHAEDEMLADGFERADVEAAMLGGTIDRRLTRDPRGVRYRILGACRDGRDMYVLCRLTTSGDVLIITVYAPGDL